MKKAVIVFSVIIGGFLFALHLASANDNTGLITDLYQLGENTTLVGTSTDPAFAIGQVNDSQVLGTVRIKANFSATNTPPLWVCKQADGPFWDGLLDCSGGTALATGTLLTAITTGTYQDYEYQFDYTFVDAPNFYYFMFDMNADTGTVGVRGVSSSTSDYSVKSAFSQPANPPGDFEFIYWPNHGVYTGTYQWYFCMVDINCEDAVNPVVSIIFPFDGVATKDFRNFEVNVNVDSATTTYFLTGVDYGTSTGQYSYHSFHPANWGTLTYFPGLAGYLDVPFLVRKPLTLFTGDHIYARPFLIYADNPELNGAVPLLGSEIDFEVDNDLALDANYVYAHASSSLTYQQSGQLALEVSSVLDTDSFLGFTGEVWIPPPELNASSTGDLCDNYFNSDFASSTAPDQAWYEKVLAWTFCIHPFVVDSFNGNIQAIKTIPVINLFLSLNSVIQGEVSPSGELLWGSTSTPSIKSQYESLTFQIPYLSTTTNFTLLSSSTWATWADQDTKDSFFDFQRVVFTLIPLGFAVILFL